MKKSRLEVTDHAVLRYLERAHGVDVEGLRRRIGRMADLGADQDMSCIVRAAGLGYQVRGGAVVTVLGRPGKRRALRRRAKA